MKGIPDDYLDLIKVAKRRFLYTSQRIFGAYN